MKLRSYLKIWQSSGRVSIIENKSGHKSVANYSVK